MSFSALRGQDDALAILRGALRSGRIPSAYLFLGPHHVGKRTTALALAMALNCRDEAARAAADACATAERTLSAVPTGTVALSTITLGPSMCSATERAAASTYCRSAEPSSPGGVPTAIICSRA